MPLTARDLGWAALLPVAAVIVFFPALSAALWLDDYTFVALSRRAASPLDFFTTEHMFGDWLYRPLPMALWWVVERLGGSVRLQYFCNAVLLGLCGAAFYWVLRELDWRRPSAALVSLLFVLLPANVGTALWLSDRFDLFAVLFELCGAALWLRYTRTGVHRLAWLVALLVLAAALSKELAYAFPAMLGIVLLLTWRDHRREPAVPPLRQAATLAGYAIIVLGVLAWRQYIGLSLVPPPTASEGLAATILRAVVRWWSALPAALVYARAPAAEIAQGYAVALVLVSATLAGLAWWRSAQLPDGASLRAGIALGAAIVALVPGVQAPHLAVIQIEFASPDGRASGLFAERYFFLGLAGLLLLLASSVAALVPWAPGARAHGAARHWTVAGGTVLMVGAIAWCVFRGAAITTGWPQESGAARRIASAAAVAATRLAPADDTPCRLRFLDSGDVNFQGVSEAMVKVVAADPRVDRCVIETERPPMYTLTDRASLPLYRSSGAGTWSNRAVHFRGWTLIHTDGASAAIGPEHTHDLVYDAARGIFEGP